MNAPDQLTAQLGFRMVSMGDGQARVDVTVGPCNANPAGSLHGGAIATLVDVAGTLAIMSADADGRPGVTSDLNVTYLAAGKPGAEVEAHATVLRVGRTLAMVTVDVRSSDKLIAQGRMTKVLR